MEPCCAVCFLGCTPKCTTPSADVQSVPRFTHLEHHGSQVHQKENTSALAFMRSLCSATTRLRFGMHALLCLPQEKQSVHAELPYFLAFIGQVFIPTREYSGQKRTTPVSSGMTPSQPHQPTVPVAANAMRTRPMTMRRMRSMPPTVNFMVSPGSVKQKNRAWQDEKKKKKKK